MQPEFTPKPAVAPSPTRTLNVPWVNPSTAGVEPRRSILQIDSATRLIDGSGRRHTAPVIQRRRVLPTFKASVAQQIVAGKIVHAVMHRGRPVVTIVIDSHHRRGR